LTIFISSGKIEGIVNKRRCKKNRNFILKIVDQIKKMPKKERKTIVNMLQGDETTKGNRKEVSENLNSLSFNRV